MLCARLLAYVAGTMNQELLLRNEYLAADNRILRGQIKGRLLLSEGRKGRHWPRSLIAWLEWSWRTWRQSLPPTVPYRRAGACMATCDPVPWRSFFDGLAAECDMAPAQISRDAYLLLGTSGARAKPLLGHWLEMQ